MSTSPSTAASQPVHPIHPSETRFAGPGELVTVTLPLEAPAPLEATIDRYSDRLRFDQPASSTVAPERLGETLLEVAEAADCARVVALTPAPVAEQLEALGFEAEAVMPGYYAGKEDCAVMGLALDPDRAGLSNPREVRRVEALLDEKAGTPGRVHPPVSTTRAQAEDAAPIAALIAQTFDAYPTPSHDPAYIAKAIDEGVPFRFVEEGGEIIACASADLVRDARTAELTDCATRPEHRGRGLMQSILTDLMDDLRGLGYPTAFTMARARIPGMNIAFQRLGFELRGTMRSSCRIGGGIEDMNVWSRPLTG